MWVFGAVVRGGAGRGCCGWSGLRVLRCDAEVSAVVECCLWTGFAERVAPGVG